MKVRVKARAKVRGKVRIKAVELRRGEDAHAHVHGREGMPMHLHMLMYTDGPAGVCACTFTCVEVKTYSPTCVATCSRDAAEMQPRCGTRTTQHLEWRTARTARTLGSARRVAWLSGRHGEGRERVQRALQRADVLRAAVERPLRVEEHQVRVGAQPPQVGEQADERGEREGRREEHDVPDGTHAHARGGQRRRRGWRCALCSGGGVGGGGARCAPNALRGLSMPRRA